MRRLAIAVVLVGCGGDSKPKSDPDAMVPMVDAATPDAAIDAPPIVCGDGLLGGTEECDDGAANSDTTADACRTTCVHAHCGDAVADTGEGCDDGNASDTDDCLNSCAVATCGDGRVRTGTEACDDGAANSDTTPDACRTTCALPRCGDAVADTGEACDDGNAADTDACRTTCTASTCAGPLRARYRFSETTGAVIDSSGCGLDGTASASVVRGVAGVGTAAQFGAAGAYVTTPGIVAGSLAADFTIEAWIFRPSASATGVIAAIGNGAGGDAFVMSIDAQGRLDVSAGVATCMQMGHWGPLGTVATNAWTHVAISVYRTSLLYMYFFVDGVYAGTSAGGNAPFCTDAADQLVIGSLGGAAPSWPGKIDEVMVWTSSRDRQGVCEDAGGIYTSSNNTCDLAAVRPPP